MTATKKAKPLTPAECVDFSKYYDLLTRRRAELLEIEQQDRQQIDQIESNGGAPGDLADLGVMDVSSDYYLKRADRDRNELIEIRNALEKIHHGTFGKCEKCKKSILAERLNRMPYARLCIDCQSNVEAREKVHHINPNPKM